MITLLKNWLFPAGKLPNTFPWTVQTAGKKYFVALWHFAVGSFVVPLLVLGSVLGLAYLPQLRDSFLTTGGALKVIGVATLIGAGLAAAVNFVRLRLKDASEIRARMLRGSLVYLTVGLAFAFAVPHLICLIDPQFPEIISWVSKTISTPDGKPNITFMMWLSMLSFFMGFGMQVRYIAREMSKEGLSLAKAMALTLAPLKGSWWGATLVNLVLPVAIAYGLTQLIGETVVYLMGPAHQPTVDLAKQATGGNFLLFALMAVVGAPIFEEIVFRGFLYQVIRCSLLRDLQPLSLNSVPASGLRRYIAIFGNALRSKSHCVGSRLHSVLGGKRAELSAIILSSLMFSLLHMQFNPTTMVLLFLLGAVQAEIYRRTGSLYTGMLLHAVNNGIDVIKLGLGHA